MGGEDVEDSQCEIMDWSLVLIHCQETVGWKGRSEMKQSRLWTGAGEENKGAVRLLEEQLRTMQASGRGLPGCFC
jgi:hypothetical protein